MLYQIIGLAFFLFLFVGILIFLYLGRRLSLWYEARFHGEKHADTHITEGAIFALLGLLIAFTFNSAATKFDGRRLLIIEEANDIGTAYLRLDLIPEESRTSLQKDFRDYLDTRLMVYQAIGDRQKVAEAIASSQAIQKIIWQKSLLGCHLADTTTACMQLIPALNNMFDIANTRISNFRLHPPIFLFIVLVGLVFLSSVLAGFSISTKKVGGSLHYISYALVVAITVYAILDMEYPRVGFIRVDNFDEVLFALKAQML